jgi:hypothetical protein
MGRKTQPRPRERLDMSVRKPSTLRVDLGNNARFVSPKLERYRLREALAGHPGLGPTGFAIPSGLRDGVILLPLVVVLQEQVLPAAFLSGPSSTTREGLA